MLPWITVALALPPVVPPLDPSTPTCLTPGILANRPAAPAASPAPYRPEAVGFVDSTVYPLRVHYRRSEDATRAADLIVPTMERCWRGQVEEMGWPVPPADSELGGDDRYDVYLTNEETYGGAYTWGTGNDTTRGDDWYSLSSYIAVDDRAIGDEMMADFLCHEFNHALQYTIDGWETTLFPWEMTAQAMEELNLPETDIYQIDVPDFQELPFMSILFDGYSDEVMAYDDYSYYEYGGAIAGLYLEERFGARDGTTLLALWNSMAQGDASEDRDFVDALDDIGGDVEADHGAVYLDLAGWRMFVGPLDDGAHFEEGGEWGAASVVFQEDRIAWADVDGLTVTAEHPPYDLGTTYWQLELDGAAGETVRIEVAGMEGVEVGVVAAVWLPGAPARVVEARSGTEGAGASVDLDLTGGERAMFGVASLGKLDMEAVGRHPRREAVASLSFVDAGSDTGDTGDGGDTDGGGAKDGGEAGCGCATGSSGSAVGVAALAGLLALARRRRG